MEKKFLLRLIEGTIGAESIYDYVEKWHTGGYTDPLHIFLGMTWEEYASWAQDPKTLASIVENRNRCLTIVEPDTASHPLHGLSTAVQ